MKQAIRKGICDIDIYGDSQLVIKQMRGEYAVKSLGLSQLYAQAKELEKAFTKVRYIHVYRHLNTRADELSNLGLLRKN
jgi:ribonuclease HI